jgi:hypothetical protein
MSNVMQNSAILPQVRAEVMEQLSRNPNFAQLPREQRAELAQDTVNALAYIVGGEDGKTHPEAVSLEDKKALPPNPAQHTKQDFQELTKFDPGDTAADRLKKSGGDILKAGSEALTDTVAKIDFPKFVGGLIDGVFNAINNSTMAQLKAYAELVKNVAKSVEEFMSDNVSPNDARNQLANKYPNILGVNMDQGQPQLTMKDDADEQAMPALFQDLGLPTDTSLDDDTIEEKVVPGMRRRMALDRQQMLATMVMMGVNRLVVTNGSIDASVLFELKSSASDKRAASVRGTYGGSQYASNYDNRSTETTTSSGGGFWGSIFGGTDTNTQDNWYRGHYDSDNAQFAVSTVSSDSSSAKLDLHTKLTGKVHVNFKSDYFPMERMLDVMSLNVAKEKLMSPEPAAAKPATTAPAAPPAPAIPVPTAPAPTT